MSASIRTQLAGVRDALFPRACARKRRWVSERVAKAVIQTRLASNRDRPQELHHYECKLCGGWHITKMKQPDEC